MISINELFSKKMQQKFKLYEKTENKNSSFFTFIYASIYKKKILLYCIVVIKFPLTRNKIIYEMYPFVTKPLSSNDFKIYNYLEKYMKFWRMTGNKKLRRIKKNQRSCEHKYRYMLRKRSEYVTLLNAEKKSFFRIFSKRV